MELCAYFSAIDELKPTTHPADSAATQFPNLSDISLLCLSVPMNSVAAEWSLSLYSDVLHDSISSENLPVYSVLYQIAGKL